VSWAELCGARNNFLGKKNFWTVLIRRSCAVVDVFYLKTGVQPGFQRKIKAQKLVISFNVIFARLLRQFYNRYCSKDFI